MYFIFLTHSHSRGLSHAVGRGVELSPSRFGSFPMFLHGWGGCFWNAKCICKRDSCFSVGWGPFLSSSQEKKWPPQTPKLWPLPSHSPQQHPKRIMSMENGMKRQPNHGGESSISSWCMMDPKLWGWVRNESHGCLMAWACLPKILLAPQFKITLSKNGWPP